MKRQFYGFLFVGSLTLSLFAQQPKLSTLLEKNLQRHVEYLASDKLEGRRAGEPGAVLAGNYVEKQFRKAGLKPGVTGGGRPDFKQPFSYTPVRDPHSAPADPTSTSTAPGAKPAFNVVGILPGRDPVLRSEAILIGAHYDHLGKGGPGSLAANSNEIHHGADDNASGTAAVIELARIFARQNRDGSGAGYKNKRTLVFIAFSGEEDGLFGSKYYINNPVWPLDRTVAMINLDMVGRLNENKLTIGGVGTAVEWKQRVDDLNASLVNLKPKNLPATGNPNMLRITGTPTSMSGSTTLFNLQLNQDGFGPSDHSSFYGKNIPVLFFFTNTHLDYHKPSDTFEKINYGGLAKITDYVAAMARAVDQNPTRPTYKVAPTTQQNTRMGFSVSLGTIPSYADSTDGMELEGVRDDSPASRAGLKKGDKVIKLAGKDIKNVYDYTAALGGMKPDTEYEIVIKRGSETLTLKIVPAAARR